MAMHRKSYIGGADVACIAGVGFLTPFELWQRKMGLAEESEPTAQMRAGLALESMILEDYESRYGVTLTCKQKFFKLEKKVNGISFGGTVDAIVQDESGANVIVVDAKLNSGFGYPDGNPQVKYTIQMQWYMMLTGALVSELHVLHLAANNFVTYSVERDDLLIERLMTISESFAKSLRIDCVPDFSVDDKIGEWLRAKWQAGMSDVEKHASGVAVEASEDIKKVREKKKEIEAKEKELMAVIFNDIGSSERLVNAFDGSLVAKVIKDKDGNAKYVRVI